MVKNKSPDSLIYLVLLSGLITLGGSKPACARSPTFDLRAAYQSALRTNEKFGVQESKIEVSEEKLSQAKGGILPTISGIGTYVRQQDPSGTQSSFTKPERPEAKITASMPIFRGFREFSGISLFGAERDAELKSRETVVLEIYKDVVRNFYAILSLETELANLYSQIDLNKKRAVELSNRRKVGRSRLSEVFSVEATVASLVAQAELTRGQLSTEREKLTHLTGLEPSASLVDREKLPSDLSDLGGVDSFLSKIKSRPDVLSQNLKSEAKDSAVSLAWGAHLPTVDLGANYYLKRTGVLEDIKWDVQATLVLPIFSGGALQSQVRQAVAERKIQELQAAETLKSADEEIRSQYQNVKADIAQIKALERSAELYEKSYEELRKEYQLGLVTNLEVLQALNSFQESKRALDRAKYAAKLDYRILIAATGEAPKL